MSEVALRLRTFTSRLVGAMLQSSMTCLLLVSNCFLDLQAKPCLSTSVLLGIEVLVSLLSNMSRGHYAKSQKVLA